MTVFNSGKKYSIIYADSIDSEEWKPIPDFYHYLISSRGRVYNTRIGKIKKSAFDHKVYRRIRLIDGRKRCATKKIHRLVAEAFLDSYSESLQVNHKNCNKGDNRIENLEMVTNAENFAHALKNGRMVRDEKGIFRRATH